MNQSLTKVNLNFLLEETPQLEQGEKEAQTHERYLEVSEHVTAGVC